MIEVCDLVKEYRAGPEKTVRAVDGISFRVDAGEMVGLLGGNGAGKTTTMRIVATLLAPTSGAARVAGHDAVRDPIGVRRSLGYVSATTGVPDRLSPREVLESSGLLHGLDRRPLGERIDALSASLDLGRFLDRPCGRLSSGQRQRVSLARALVHDPPALVLDEPTSTLDVVGARHLLDMLQDLRQLGRTVLVSTHRLHEIEHRCDRFVVIDAGRIVASGSREDLIAGRPGGLEEAFFAAIGGGQS